MGAKHYDLAAAQPLADGFPVVAGIHRTTSTHAAAPKRHYTIKQPKAATNRNQIAVLP